MLSFGIELTLLPLFCLQTSEAAEPGFDRTPRHEAIVLDDDIPGPDPPRWITTPQADAQLDARSGNPYFLSFVAGRHYPPTDERLDPALGDAIAVAGRDQRPRQEIYAYLMLNKRITATRLERLTALGLRPLGVQPYYAVRVAVPIETLPQVAADPEVRWIGRSRSWQKVHPDLAARLGSAGSKAVPVVISVMESDLCERSVVSPGPKAIVGGPGEDAIEVVDPASRGRTLSNGWMQQALERLGITITNYDDRQRAFSAELRPDRMLALAELDFVQFVEAQLPLGTLHDESMPMINADFGRVTFDGDFSQSVVAGIIDSGFDAQHTALDHGYYVGWNESGSTTGASFDGCGHGSHVAGTILGEPNPTDASYRGAAPALGNWQSGRFRFVKYHDDACTPSTVDYANVVAHMRTTFVDASGITSPRPMVINNSYGTPGSWFGSEYYARVVDDEVYDNDQIYVISAGNSGSAAGTISVPGVAKNALTVGSVYAYAKNSSDLPGTVSSSSSRGPCADGRWKPNLVAPGDFIQSVLAESGSSFIGKSGTSMAAPHVTGAVAQILDRFPLLDYQPARLASLLQATAITKNDVLLDSPGNAHLDAYGCGRVDVARVLIGQNQAWSWANWGFTSPATIISPIASDGDFVVTSSVRRLVVCMSYVEPSSLPGAGAALIHDYDLYIDSPPISPLPNVGDYGAQQSALDNTEIRIIENPTPGVWRWKAYPTSVIAPLVDPPKVSITVTMIYEDTTPSGTFSVTADDTFVRPGETVEITGTAAVNTYVASAVFLDSTTTPFTPNIESTIVELHDGVTADLTGNSHAGYDVLLGDILGQSSRSARWSVYWPTEGTMNFAVTPKSDNYSPGLASVNIVVDGTPPTAPATLTSGTHSVNVWSNESTVKLAWPAASDGLSGIDGYSVGNSPNSPQAPDDVTDTSGLTATVTLPTSGGNQYVNVRSVDKSGNASTGFASLGPLKIDAVAPPIVAVLSSPSHVASQWSKDETLVADWQMPQDAGSGVAGYSISVSFDSSQQPDTTVDLGLVTHHEIDLPSSTKGYYFNIRPIDLAKNAANGVTSIGPYFIDITAPSQPTNLNSPTHSIGVPSTNTAVKMNWTASTDTHSGIAGYSVVFDHVSNTVPDGIVEIPSTTHTTPLTIDGQDYWFHVRAVDVAGNASPTAHLGPFKIGVCTGSANAISYGTGKPGTNGVPQLVATALPVLGGTTVIEIQQSYPGALPILIIGAAPTSQPFELGTLLVVPLQVFSIPVPLTANGSLPIAGALPLDPLLCGASVYLQALIPDPGAIGVNHLAITPGLQLILGT